MTKKQSLLWEISQNNKDKGYLFGTMHVSGKVAFSNFELIYNLIDSCDSLATEISLDNSTQREMGKHMNLPAHTSLRELISNKKFDKYQRELNKYFNVELEYFINLMPLFLINLITQKSIISDEKLMNQSMDLECWNYAKEKGLNLMGIETFEDHINTLYAIPIAYQLDALKSALSNLPKFKKKSKKLLYLYVSQNIHLLYKSSKKSLGEIKKVLLYDRNVKMAISIIEKTKDQKTFFAFGAGHLSGRNGVIHLLKQAGYEVRPSKTAHLLKNVE